MSIQTTDDNTNLSDEAAEAALMETLGASPEGEAEEGDSSEEPDETYEDGDETESLEADAAEDAPEEDDTSEDEEDAAASPQEIGDDQVVKVTVNGEAQEFTVGSLKRLAGQEASLTRKSQEADLVGGRAAATLQAALEAAQEDIVPYADIDWLTLQAEMDPGEFKWHRENAQRADARFRKLVQTAQTFETALQERQAAAHGEAVQAAQAELAADVPGWNDKMDADVRAFGIKNGLDPKDVAGIANAKVLKLLRKAMMYDQAQAVATKKVKAAPEKVLKGGSRQASAVKVVNAKKAEKRLASTGSSDDAVAVLMGRWG